MEPPPQIGSRDGSGPIFSGADDPTTRPALVARTRFFDAGQEVVTTFDWLLDRDRLRIDACIGLRTSTSPQDLSLLPQTASIFAGRIDNPVWEERTLIQGAVEVPELNKMQEIVTMLANLWDAAHQLPEGLERQNALREVGGYQIRIAAFVRRRCSAA
jgi:hypothetical protein